MIAPKKCEYCFKPLATLSKQRQYHPTCKNGQDVARRVLKTQSQGKGTPRKKKYVSRYREEEYTLP